MTDEQVAVGQAVRIKDAHRRGIVEEVDPALFVARVRLNAGGETWVRWDDLEAIPVWDRTHIYNRSIA